MYKIGIDLGGTYIKGGIIKNKTDIVYKTSIETPESHSPADVCQAINELITILRNNLATGPDECEMVGVGCPGTVDSEKGIVLYSNNFNWNRPVYVADAISEVQHLPVKISNDANCAALGEYQINNYTGTMLLITLGTGLGTGVVDNGILYEGGHAGAIEMGHMIIKDGGRKCTCGNRGCLEAYVSTKGLIKTANKYSDKKGELNKLFKSKKKPMIKDITDAVRLNDKYAVKAFNKYLDMLTKGMASMINIFRPDTICIGGGISASFDLMEEYFNENVKGYCFGREKVFVPKIIQASGGNDAGIIGAANL